LLLRRIERPEVSPQPQAIADRSETQGTHIVIFYVYDINAFAETTAADIQAGNFFSWKRHFGRFVMNHRL
jgi:hypothetical protein